MSRIFVPISFFFLLLACACDNRHISEAAVAFYNCENLFDTVHNPGKQDEEFTPAGKYHYTSAMYKEKLHNVAAVLDKMATDELPSGPALIGLAEVENGEVLKALTSQPAIARRHYGYVWYNGPDKRGINVALLYNPMLFKVISSEAIAVPLDTGATTRDILHVCGVLCGDTIDVLVNHWPSRTGGVAETEMKRVKAATICSNKLDTLLVHRDKVLVMGDFNEDPDDSCMVRILAATGDSVKLTAKQLYNPWAGLYKSGAGTLMYKHQWYLFDQILVSPAFLGYTPGWHLAKVEVFTPAFMLGKRSKNEKVPRRSFAGTYWLHGYSDHFPVILYLKNAQ